MKEELIYKEQKDGKKEKGYVPTLAFGHKLKDNESKKNNDFIKEMWNYLFPKK